MSSKTRMHAGLNSGNISAKQNAGITFTLPHEVAEKLKQTIKLSADVGNYLDNVFAELSRIITDKFPELSAKWQKNNAIIAQLTEQMQKNPHDSLENIINLYTDFDAIVPLFDSQLDIITDKNVLEMYFTGMSPTFVREMSEKQEIIRELLRDIQSRVSGEQSQAIMKSVFAQLDYKHNYDKIADEILTETNTFTVFCIKELIKLLPAKNAKLLSKLESLKDNALETPDNIFIRDGSLTKQLLIKWGLIPMGRFRGLDEIFSCIGEKFNKSADVPGNINILLKKYNLLLLRRYRARYIDYNFLAMISDNYVTSNGLQIAQKIGLNEKVIRKYDTAIVIDAENPDEYSGKKESIQYISAGKVIDAEFNASGKCKVSADTLILECLNDKYFRILSDNIGEYVVNGCGHKDKFFAGEIAEKISAGLSLRPHQYGEIMEEIIMSRCINRNHRRIMLGYVSSKVTKPSAEQLKRNIISGIVNTFSDIYAEKTPTNIADLSRLLADNTPIINTISYVLTNHFGVRDDIELKLSFMRYLDSVAEVFERKYRNAINELFSERLITRKLFEDYPAQETLAQIRGIFSAMIEKIIAEMDTKPSIWEENILTMKEYVIDAEGSL